MMRALWTAASGMIGEQFHIDTIANKADFYTSYDYSFDPDKNKLKKAIFSVDGLKGLLEKYDIVVKA